MTTTVMQIDLPQWRYVFHEYPELRWAYSKRQVSSHYTQPVSGVVTITDNGFYAVSGYR